MVVVAHMALGLALRLVSRAKVSAARVVPPFLVVLMMAGSAFAAIPEFCGDTVRGLAHHNCSHGDADNDGYVAADDCDDTDMWIFPGMATGDGCSAGQIKKCQVDGTYTSCAAINCSDWSTSGTCKYIDGTSGNDANAGTEASPWQTFAKVGHYVSAGDRPAGWYDLAAGDTVFVTGNMNTEYAPGAPRQNSILRVEGSTQSGSAGNLIAFRAWPGKTRPVLNGTGTTGSSLPVIVTDTVHHVWFDGFDCTDNWQSCFNIGDSDDVRISRSYIHDTYGPAANNISGITSNAGSANHVYDRNVILDVWDDQDIDGSNNSSGIVMFRPEDGLIEYNVIGYTETTGAPRGNPVKIKHAATKAASGTTTVRHNVMFNGLDFNFGPNQYGLHVYGNRFLEAPVAIKYYKQSGPSQIGDAIFELNTSVNAPLFQYDPTLKYNTDNTTASDECSGNSPIDEVIVRRNIAVDDDASYGSNEGFYVVYPEGPDAIFADVITDGDLVIDDNTLWNSAAAGFRSSVFEENDTSDVCGSDIYGSGSGTDGAAYTSLATWQAAGFDATSHNADPQLNSDHIPAHAGSLTRGWTGDLTPPAVDSNSGRGNVFAQ